MSQRQCIRELTANGEADSIFLLGNASLQQSRNGPYWRLELRDASGAMEAKIWSPLSSSFHDLAAGQLVRVRGRVGLFRDQPQLTVDEMSVLTEEEVARLDLSAFMPASPRPVPDMLDELEHMVAREFTHAPWRAFVRSVLDDERVRHRLPVAPAAKSVHHAYVGGLLEHMLSVAGLCLRMADHYPELDRQLLCAAGLLHDIGKLEEMSGGMVNDYTDAGRFLGHITQGLLMMEPHLAASGLEPELALHFRHLIASHHGELEFGSPRQPATAEAFVLHYADNIDAKIAQWRGLFPPRSTAGTAPEENMAAGLEWSPWQNLLGRALCRVPGTPSGPSRETPDDMPETSFVAQGEPVPDETSVPRADDRNCGSEDADELPVGADVTFAGLDGAEEITAEWELSPPLSPWTEADLMAEAERSRAAETPAENVADTAPEISPEIPREAEKETVEGAPREGGKPAPKSPRKRRKAADAVEEREAPDAARPLTNVPAGVPGEADGKPDKAREKDLTQCSLL